MTKKEETKASFSRLQNFFRVVPWLILVFTLLISGLTLFQSMQAKESLFRAWVTELSYKKRIEFKRLVEPVVTNLKIARDWGRENGFEIDKTEQINRQFTPILKNIPQIHALIIANSLGQSYFLRYQNGSWQSRWNDPQARPGKALFFNWQEGESADEGRFMANDYDVRQRPWFKGALNLNDEEELFWTTPYSFFFDGQIGITAALSWASRNAAEAGHKNGSSRVTAAVETYVVAFDVKLCDLLGWLADLELGPDGRAFMVSDSGKILGNSERDGRQSDNSVSVVENRIEEKFAPAFAKWQRSPEHEDQIFSFRAAGKPWWAGFAALEVGDRHLWLVVVVPEKDILQIADYPVTYFLLPILVFGIGIVLFFLSFFFVRRHLHSLEELRRENHRLIEDELQREAVLDDPTQRIYELIRAGESERLEFKSTVRWNLHQNRTGKEIEIAWLKGIVGFLNTTGGVLLIGVEDDGKIAGLERDNFVNDDKCLRHIDSLISVHIGLEFSRFIHFAIIEMESNKIVEIRCQVSDIPAFLKKGETEEFFIRTGPASRKLKPSQMIKYLASRKSTVADKGNGSLIDE